MRTTIDIDDPILKDLKRLQKRERKSLGRLVSDLLAYSLRQRETQATRTQRFVWISRPMGARVELSDRETVLEVMDETSRTPRPRPPRR